MMERPIDLSGIDLRFHESMEKLSRTMTKHGIRREDPVRSVFGLLGDRWSTLILLVLASGDWRYSELRRILGRLGSEEKISQRVLTLKLRTLERDGMVARHVIDRSPPRVSYELTPLGRELHIEAERLIDWVIEREVSIEEARSRFDRVDD